MGGTLIVGHSVDIAFDRLTLMDGALCLGRCRFRVAGCLFRPQQSVENLAQRAKAGQGHESTPSVAADRKQWLCPGLTEAKQR